MAEILGGSENQNWSSWKRCLAWALVWLASYSIGIPYPNRDDLFFVGTAVNISKHGEFSNPHLASWNAALETGKFYYQPPYYSYVLAGWLKLTGVSTQSLLLFQCLCYIAVTTLITLLCDKLGLPTIVSVAVSASFALWIINLGLRADSLALAFLFLGLYLLTYDTAWSFFWGFSFLGASVLTYIVTAAYGAPLAAALIAMNARKRSPDRPSWYWTSRVAAVIGASALNLFIFCQMIHGDLPGFLAAFLRHASWRRTPTLQAIPHFLELLTYGWGWLLCIPTFAMFVVATIAVFVQRKWIPYQRLWVYVAIFSGLILNIVLYSSAISYATFFVQTGIVIALCSLKLGGRVRYGWIGCYSVIFMTSHLLTLVVLLATDRSYDLPDSVQKIAVAVTDEQLKTDLAIDSTAARYVFDFDIPDSIQDWFFIQSPPSAYPLSLADKQPGTTWLVSQANLHAIIPEAIPAPPRIQILGRQFHSLPKRPNELIVIE
ncbi:hypothetical protein GC163_23945 [bacterium]|nr:hypothetical protein [bacterium]